MRVVAPARNNHDAGVPQGTQAASPAARSLRSAARTSEVVQAALVAMGVTMLGLCALNTSDALPAVLEGRSTAVYWAQAGLIAGYAAILLGLFRRAVSRAA